MTDEEYNTRVVILKRKGMSHARAEMVIEEEQRLDALALLSDKPKETKRVDKDAASKHPESGL